MQKVVKVRSAGSGKDCGYMHKGYRCTLVGSGLGCKIEFQALGVGHGCRPERQPWGQVLESGYGARLGCRGFSSVL